jgi:uncharacterized protein YjbI with pentapeptide repeats
MPIGIVLLILLIRVGYTTQWTGLKGKTLWDWLNLLGTLAIPLVVVLATIGFGWWQTQGALDQQRATILQTYMDNMQDLMLKYNLLGDSPKPNNSSDAATIQETRELARARTLTALRGLDPQRKGILLQFLYEANLIGFKNSIWNSKTNHFLSFGHPAIIDLTNADLSGAFLGSTSLIFMSNVDLSFANLSGADLSGADLVGARLFGTHLEGAKLIVADLRDAEIGLPYLKGTNLEYAMLQGANLYSTDLSGTDLKGATLSCSNIAEPPDLPSRCTDLTKTNITQQQLDQVSSCKGALLPKGIICHKSTD